MKRLQAAVGPNLTSTGGVAPFKICAAPFKVGADEDKLTKRPGPRPYCPRVTQPAEPAEPVNTNQMWLVFIHTNLSFPYIYIVIFLCFFLINNILHVVTL